MLKKSKSKALKKTEASKLARRLREKQGNIKAAHERSGLSIVTIKRASKRLPLRQNTIKKIRTFLLDEN